MYKGACCGLVDSPDKVINAEFHHGDDGMNDTPETIPLNSSKQAEPDKTAVEALISLARTDPGLYTIVAIGPLTNIAMVTRLCPEFPDLIRGLYVMGGSIRRGNMTPWAEFNFYCDPLAARITLQHFCSYRHALLHLVPWDTCIVPQNTLANGEIDRFLDGKEHGKPNERVRTILKATMYSYKRKHHSKRERIIFADHFIPLLLVHPESVQETELYGACDVNCDKEDEKCALVSLTNRSEADKGDRGVRVYTKFDMTYLCEMYKNVIYAGQHDLN